MTDESERTDLSVLDPVLLEEPWEARVSETLEQQTLLAEQDLESLSPDVWPTRDTKANPFAGDAMVSSIVEQAELLKEQDLSSLAPLWSRDAVVSSILEQAELLSVRESEKPQPLARVANESPKDIDVSATSLLVQLAPRAIALGACLAAAVWLLVWVAPLQPAMEDPALELMGWAQSDEESARWLTRETQ